MLTYLLGDVLRIYSGDFKPGEIGGMKISQDQWLGVAVLMVIPVVMGFLSLTLNYPVSGRTSSWLLSFLVSISLDCLDTLQLTTNS